MNGLRKPRKPRWAPCADNMAHARHYAAKPSQEDRAEVIGKLVTAVKALREGVGSDWDWAVAAGSHSVAMAIERTGIVRGLREHLGTIAQALQAIHDRASRPDDTWVCTPLHFCELDALQEFVRLHTYQINQLGRAELLAAMNTAQRYEIEQGQSVTMDRSV